MERFFGILGVIFIFLIAFLISNNRKAINYKTVATGFVLQILLAVFVFKVPIGRQIFLAIGSVIQKILEFAKEGGSFVFGALINNPEQFDSIFGSGNQIFALQLICATIFMMILVNILYYYHIMQRVVMILGKAMNKIMGVSGAEALSNVASSFVGQITAQIMIKPYLAKLTRSELLASMAGSMACASGAMLPIYVSMGIPVQYLLASSIMAAPGALVMSKIVYPEVDEAETKNNIKISRRRTHANVFDAIASGASEGMMVAINVIAMLLALVALVAMVDWMLGKAGMFVYHLFNMSAPLWGIDFTNLSLKMLLGKFFAVFAYLMGVPFSESTTVGSLMGTKIILNEVFAYNDLIQVKDLISEKSFIIASFALCSFGNFGSIATQLGGIGELAPNQRRNLARLGLRALICGTLTCFMSATIAGILLH